MTDKEIIKLIKEKWDSQGECKSCGWHDVLSAYDIESDDPDYILEEDKKRIWLPCHNPEEDRHRGVRIYY